MLKDELQLYCNDDYLLVTAYVQGVLLAHCHIHVYIQYMYILFKGIIKCVVKC